MVSMSKRADDSRLNCPPSSYIRLLPIMPRDRPAANSRTPAIIKHQRVCPRCIMQKKACEREFALLYQPDEPHAAFLTHPPSRNPVMVLCDRQGVLVLAKAPDAKVISRGCILFSQKRERGRPPWGKKKAWLQPLSLFFVSTETFLMVRSVVRLGRKAYCWVKGQSREKYVCSSCAVVTCFNKIGLPSSTSTSSSPQPDCLVVIENDDG